MLTTIGQIVVGDGTGLLHGLIVLLVVGICFAIVWWLGKLACVKLGLPPMVLMCWNGLFILLGALFVINLLLSLIGHPLIVW